MDLSIKEHLLMETLQDKEDIFLIMVVYMREVLNKTMHLVLEHINGKMDLNIVVNS